MPGWQGNVTTLRNYISTRCTALTQGMIDCYNLTGPFPIIVDVVPAGAGTVDLNSLSLDQFSWSGSYFGGIPIILTTTPTSSQYTFDHWELLDTPTPSTTSDSIQVNLTQAQTIVAHYTEGPAVVLGNVFIPTAFSPNGDQNNDMFWLHGLEPSQTFVFRVFNRWGQLVFETTSMANGWDGNTNGKPNPSDVYAYMIEVTNPDGTTESKSGNITLMR